MKFSALGVIDGNARECNRLVLNYRFGTPSQDVNTAWEVNISINPGQTVIENTGLCSIMILAPSLTKKGMFQTVCLDWQTWQDVHEILEKCKVGDRSVFEKTNPPSISGVYGTLEH
jgi:hypothetical protein